MSARTPFIPVAKDPRASNTKEQTQNLNQSLTNNVFSPDLSNPLHASAATQSGPNTQSKVQDVNHASQSLTSNGSGNSSGTNDTRTQRPLNLSGLIKKTNRNVQAQGQFQNQGGSRRPSFAGSPTVRPGTADPHSKAHQNQEHHRQSHNQSTDIIAPIPRQVIRAPSPLLPTTQTSGLIPSSMRFETSLPPNISTEKSNDAHTSTSALGFSFAKAKATPEHQQLPSPPTSIRINSTRSFEPHPVIDLDQEVSPFSLNTSLPNQTGPQRVLINADGNHNNIDAAQESHRGNHLKRPRTDHEQIVGDLATSTGKRYKDITGGYNARPTRVPSPTSPPNPNLSFHSQYRPSHSSSPEVMVNTSRQNCAPLTPPHHEHAYHHDDHDTHMDDVPRALDKLLGRDTDAYIDENMDKYERATDRWRDCPMEDWVAGANELAARYGKLLDFVKTHLTTKMKLFASFDAKVDAHNIVLEERERVLDGVKERLVHESGNVLGRSKPQ